MPIMCERDKERERDRAGEIREQNHAIYSDFRVAMDFLSRGCITRPTLAFP